MHHLLLFIPLLALFLFLWLPWKAALPGYLVLSVVSLVAYWKAIQALRQRPIMGRRAMVGDRAVVVKVQGSEVEVEYKGEIWSAVSAQPLEPGQQVTIEKAEGLTLHVNPSPKPADEGRA
jgi:membrane protein implicated in regulation of membrane protease activity